MGTVLVATELGIDAAHTLELACKYAREADHRVVALHVVPYALPHRPLFPHHSLPDSLAALDLQARARDALAELLASSPALGAVEPRISTDDDPATGILAVADELDAALIVVGGGTRERRWLFGSTADRVVTHARVPVLVARPMFGTEKILAATDFSDPSLPAVSAAFAIAKARSVSPIVLHCVPLPAPSAFALTPVGSPSTILLGELTKPLIEGARKRLEEIASEHGGAPTILVELGEPADVIVNAAEREDVGTLVVGTRGRTGLSRLLLGSVARSVTANAPCSVLVVRLSDR